MKFFLAFACLWAFPAFANSSFHLDDPAILGRYILAAPNRNSDLQTANLVYNSDNQLVVQTDRSDVEYELSAPDKDGIVYSGTDEMNCDGDESECSYDSQTVIRLLAAKDGNGHVIPQLQITITVAYAWSTNCGGTDTNGNDQPACDDEVTTYTLNWNKPLPYSIPFYVKTPNPAGLEAIETSCMQQLKEVVFESRGTAYLGAAGICSRPTSSFKYRGTFEQAFPYILQAWLGGNEEQPVEVTAKDVATAFENAKSLAATYKAPGPVTSKMIADQLNRIEGYVLKHSDRFFRVPAIEGVNEYEFKMFMVNSEAQIVTKLSVKMR